MVRRGRLLWWPPWLCARKKNSLVARAFAGAVVKMVVAPLCERRWLSNEEDGVAMMVALRRRRRWCATRCRGWWLPAVVQELAEKIT